MDSCLGFARGHSITVTSSSERGVLTDFPVWLKVLSCINIAGWLIAVLKLRTTCFFNISLYTVALILLCSLSRGPIPAAEVMPNTIILPLQNLTLLLVLWGKYHSLGLHQINLLSSQLNRLTSDSSLKWTQPHCSLVHMTYSVADFNQLFVLFRNVKLRGSNSIVQIYFIMSSGNSVPWYFDAKVSISSFRDSDCYVCHKSFFFDSLPIHVFPYSIFFGLSGGFLASHDSVS